MQFGAVGADRFRRNDMSINPVGYTIYRVEQWRGKYTAHDDHGFGSVVVIVTVVFFWLRLPLMLMDLLVGHDLAYWPFSPDTRPYYWFPVIALVFYLIWKIMLRYVDLDALMRYYAKETPDDRRRRGRYVLVFLSSPFLAIALAFWLGFVHYPSL
jgi:hypothetical protein